MSLPHEVVKALRGHKAGKGWVLSWDGARPKWTQSVSGLACVNTTAPVSPATGQLWYDTDATC